MICWKLNHYQWSVRLCCSLSVSKPVQPELGHLQGVCPQPSPVPGTYPQPFQRQGSSSTASLLQLTCSTSLSEHAGTGDSEQHVTSESSSVGYSILEFLTRQADVTLPHVQWWLCLGTRWRDPAPGKLPFACNTSYIPDFCRSGIIPGTFKFWFRVKWATQVQTDSPDPQS